MIKKFFLLFFLSIILESCAIHSNFPFICFLKKCRQEKSNERHLAARIKRNRAPKLKATMVSRKALPKKYPADHKKAEAQIVSKPSFSN